MRPRGDAYERRSTLTDDLRSKSLTVNEKNMLQVAFNVTA